MYWTLSWKQQFRITIGLLLASYVDYDIESQNKNCIIKPSGKNWQKTGTTLVFIESPSRRVSWDLILETAWFEKQAVKKFQYLNSQNKFNANKFKKILFAPWSRFQPENAIIIPQFLKYIHNIGVQTCEK